MRGVSVTSAVLSLFVVFCFAENLRAQNKAETVVPAGTLVNCTLNDFSFSSNTAQPGDPVICDLKSVLLFGRSVFSRGAYLAGHVVTNTKPGRIVGKGSVGLEFDRLGMPHSELPLSAKVVAAAKYKVNVAGDIVGKGHATRDAIEWMIPPLWPIKLLALPARGPQVVSKGEQQLTLRIMDDLIVPAESQSNLETFNGSSPSSSQPTDDAAHDAYSRAPRTVFVYVPRSAPPPVYIYRRSPGSYAPPAYFMPPRTRYGRHRQCGGYGCW